MGCITSGMTNRRHGSVRLSTRHLEFARVLRTRPHGLRPGRHHAQARGPSDDPRRPAHLPIYGLEDLGFVPRRGPAVFVAERNTGPSGKLPLNTNGGGLSYLLYTSGMYALQESVRQMRGTAPPKSPTPGSRSATASAACLPPPAPSSCRTRRHKRSNVFSHENIKLIDSVGVGQAAPTGVIAARDFAIREST
jgi:hypothetical protein